MKKTLLLVAFSVAFGWCLNAQEFMVNEDFESFEVGDGLVAEGNFIEEYNGTSTVTEENGNKYATVASTGIYTLWYDDITVEAGKTYIFEATLRSPEGKKITLTTYLPSGSYDNLAKVGDGVTDWATYSHSVTIEEDGLISIGIYWYWTGMQLDIDNFRFYEESTTAIGDVEMATFTVSPNPSNGIFRISGSQPIASYSVYNAAGQIVKEATGAGQNEVTVDLTNAAHGLYVVHVKDTNGENTISKVVLK